MLRDELMAEVRGMGEDGGSGRNRQSQHLPQEARPKVRGCSCIGLAAIRQFVFGTDFVCFWHLGTS